MIVRTRRFGDIDVKETDIIEISGGLLGFENTQHYVLLDHDDETPFKWLQAVDNPELAFVVMEPFIFYPTYEFDLSQSDIKDLGLTRPEEAAVLVILTVNENPEQISANIKAPVVIKQADRRGKQVVLTNEQYPVKYYLFRD